MSLIQFTQEFTPIFEKFYRPAVRLIYGVEPQEEVTVEQQLKSIPNTDQQPGAITGILAKTNKQSAPRKKDRNTIEKAKDKALKFIKVN
ncbi:hypothetical protein P5673_004329 [Acropora cervicornis]|uniref:Uncharacterized protein n=1 Tax=Acropora cervicornis TaxID=6130 RepID=A0AAD9R077_ACRCE|nr:hypothetical protein P5673_004329 [Acropora cervicornis]